MANLSIPDPVYNFTKWVFGSRWTQIPVTFAAGTWYGAPIWSFVKGFF